MAATKLISMHRDAGHSVLNCLRKRIAYSLNPDKTNNGQYVSSYGCTVGYIAEEFMLMRREYLVNTGRAPNGEIIAYQIRQSFKPGEITAELANRLGYETAMRFTKGEHAFVVATHVDREHIHNHIIFSSVALDLSRKFNNFFLSGMALQKISDKVCLENSLSIIEPKPYSERVKYEYPKKVSLREKLCSVIDEIMKQPPDDFEEFLRRLEVNGYEIHRGKYVSVRSGEQKSFIRLSSLKDGYTENDIRRVLAEGNIGEEPERWIRTAKKPATPKPKKSRTAVEMMIDIEERMRNKNSPYYLRWAASFNTRQMLNVLSYLRENDTSYEELLERRDSAAGNERILREKIADLEKRLKEIGDTKQQIFNYSKTRDVYAQYKISGFDRKFREAHSPDIEMHEKAKMFFESLHATTLPTVKQLQEEYESIVHQKQECYKKLRTARDESRELQIIVANIETILGKDEPQEQSEPQQDSRQRTN